jgi:hypothetical protein
MAEMETEIKEIASHKTTANILNCTKISPQQRTSTTFYQWTVGTHPEGQRMADQVTRK